MNDYNPEQALLETLLPQVNIATTCVDITMERYFLLSHLISFYKERL